MYRYIIKRILMMMPVLVGISIITLLVDLSYGLIDPRIRGQYDSKGKAKKRKERRAAENV